MVVHSKSRLIFNPDSQFYDFNQYGRSYGLLIDKYGLEWFESFLQKMQDEPADRRDWGVRLSVVGDSLLCEKFPADRPLYWLDTIVANAVADPIVVFTMPAGYKSSETGIGDEDCNSFIEYIDRLKAMRFIRLISREVPSLDYEGFLSEVPYLIQSLSLTDNSQLTIMNPFEDLFWKTPRGRLFLVFKREGMAQYALDCSFDEHQPDYNCKDSLARAIILKKYKEFQQLDQKKPPFSDKQAELYFLQKHSDCITNRTLIYPPSENYLIEAYNEEIVNTVKSNYLLNFITEFRNRLVKAYDDGLFELSVLDLAQRESNMTVIEEYFGDLYNILRKFGKTEDKNQYYRPAQEAKKFVERSEKRWEKYNKEFEKNMRSKRKKNE